MNFYELYHSNATTTHDSYFHAIITNTLRKVSEQCDQNLRQLECAVRRGHYSQSKSLFDAQLCSTRCTTFLNYMKFLQSEYEGHLRIGEGAQSLLNAHLANKSSYNVLERVKRQAKHNSQLVHDIGVQFESSLGAVKLVLKELVGFTRICPRDQYLVTVTYCEQRLRSRCRVNVDGSQMWSNDFLIARSTGYESRMLIKVYESGRFGTRAKLGNILLDKMNLYRDISEREVLTDVNQCGTVKLRIVLQWIPPFQSPALWKLYEPIITSHSYNNSASYLKPIVLKSPRLTDSCLRGEGVVGINLNRSISMRLNPKLELINNQSLHKHRFTSFHESKLLHAYNPQSTNHFSSIHIKQPTTKSTTIPTPLLQPSISRCNQQTTNETSSFVIDKKSMHCVSVYLNSVDGVLTCNSNTPPITPSSTSSANALSPHFIRNLEISNKLDDVLEKEEERRATNDYTQCQQQQPSLPPPQQQPIKSISTPNLVFVHKTADSASFQALNPVGIKEFKNTEHTLETINEVNIVDDCFNFLDSDYGTSETNTKAEIQRSLSKTSTPSSSCCCLEKEQQQQQTWPVLKTGSIKNIATILSTLSIKSLGTSSSQSNLHSVKQCLCRQTSISMRNSLHWS